MLARRCPESTPRRASGSQQLSATSHALENTMRVLIIFATTDGQTRKIAERAAVRIRDLGHEVHIYDSSALFDKLQIGAFAAIIAAASVHQQLHQETITDFAIAHRDQLNAKLTAFISVSLPAALESDGLE